MNTTYKIYCIGSVLFDKTKNYIFSNSKDYEQPERIYEINNTPLDNLYNLTYDSTKIIDRLYLGNSYNARDFYSLEDNNIGLIVNSSPCVPNYFIDYFDYFNVNVKDIEGQNMLIHLEKVVEYMNDYLSLNSDKSIFVHCFMGCSRSVTIIIAYLIRYNNFRLRDAMNFIKEKRDIVNLNKDFFNQLVEYEKKYL